MLTVFKATAGLLRLSRGSRALEGPGSTVEVKIDKAMIFWPDTWHFSAWGAVSAM